MIRYLPHEEIDKSWWDHQLLMCSNRMWYAQSWLLDLTSPGWDALIDEGSGAIMPLTWRRKFLINYLFQPYGSQQLGVFAPEYSNFMGEAFLNAIPRKLRLWDIVLNEAMGPLEMQGMVFTALVQQVLPLNTAADELRRNYSKGHQRNLRKAPNGPVITSEISAKEFTELFTRTTAKRYGSGSPQEHRTLECVIDTALRMGQCTILGIRTERRVYAAACFMEWENRAIFYKSGAEAGSPELKAMFRITDAYIERKAGTGLLLDFAGSNTPSVARFNSGFGAQGRIYLRLQRNDLPDPFKWFKK